MAEAALPTENTCKIRHVHIECPICLTRFKDPKILDCLHGFCFRCLQELVEKQDPKTDTVVCPVCRKKTPIPEEGLSDLLNCFFLSSLVDDVNDLEGSEEESKPSASSCEGCDEGLEAVAWCVDCNAKVCKMCLENHAKLKFIQHHQIVQGDGRSNEQLQQKRKTEPPKCRKHTDQERRYYCDTCDLLACPVCVVIDHRASNHNLSEINDSVRSYHQAVEEALQKFEDCRKQFQKVDDSINYSQHTLQLMVDRALQDIVAKEEEEITKIRNASRLLQDRVTQIGQERGRECDRVRSSNRDKMSRAEQIIASVNDLMQHADDFELLDLKPKVMHNLEFHKELQFETVQHSKSFITFKGHDVVNDVDLGKILEEEKWKMKTELGKMGECDGNFKFAVEVACLSNSDIAVTDITRNSLFTYTSEGCYKSTCAQSETGDGQLKSPWGVAVTSDDRFMVTDGEYVKVYNKELQYLSQFNPSQGEVVGQSRSLLRGIAVDKKNLIAVADGGRKVISLHNVDGSIISTIPHDDISDISFLSVSSKERVIFTNYHARKLVCLDFTGNEVFNINTPFHTRSLKPVGVFCDEAGDIYLSTHRSGSGSGVGTGEVHHYDASGEHIGLVARGLCNPQGVVLSPTGDLIVADMHSVKILHRV